MEQHENIVEMVKSILQLVTYSSNYRSKSTQRTASKLNAKWAPHNPKNIEFANMKHKEETLSEYMEEEWKAVRW